MYLIQDKSSAAETLVTELYRQVREGTNEYRVYKIQAVH
jgi:hypothetical protein